jgi:hypothetical protein
VKKKLFIDSRPGGDWGLDLFFSGLLYNLGPEFVIDFPSHEKHRMGRPILTGDREYDWGAERRSLSFTPSNLGVPISEQKDVVSEIRSGNIDTIFIDERRESFEIYMGLRADLTDIPVVVIAGHDQFQNVSPEWVKANYYPRNLKMMYLDNWRGEYSKLPYARPYSWSVNFDHLWDPSERIDLLSKKEYDICFMGYSSHGNRSRYIDHVTDRWKQLNNHIFLERRPNSFDGFIPKRDYFRIIAQSRICLNLRGAAENGKTMRFYVIPYVGSYMLSEKFPGIDKQLTPIVCDSFSSTEELDLKIEWALENERAREKKAALNHWQACQNNSSRVRVRSILEDLKYG